MQCAVVRPSSPSRGCFPEAWEDRNAVLSLLHRVGVLGSVRFLEGGASRGNPLPCGPPHQISSLSREIVSAKASANGGASSQSLDGVLGRLEDIRTTLFSQAAVPTPPSAVVNANTGACPASACRRLRARCLLKCCPPALQRRWRMNSRQRLAAGSPVFFPPPPPPLPKAWHALFPPPLLSTGRGSRRPYYSLCMRSCRAHMHYAFMRLLRVCPSPPLSLRPCIRSAASTEAGSGVFELRPYQRLQYVLGLFACRARHLRRWLLGWREGGKREAAGAVVTCAVGMAAGGGEAVSSCASIRCLSPPPSASLARHPLVLAAAAVFLRRGRMRDPLTRKLLQKKRALVW